jgi:hypothetical protein
MPAPVDRYFKKVKASNSGYSDSQAWATAWSIYCKSKNPGSTHCKQKPSAYSKKESVSRLSNLIEELRFLVLQKRYDRYKSP